MAASPNNPFTKEDLKNKEGFPFEHTAAFLEIAKDSGCVISTRTPGPACEGLLAAGYDAKSFAIKAKSCDWGPAAGFLCIDPLLNKKYVEGASTNAKDNYKSMTTDYDVAYDINRVKKEFQADASAKKFATTAQIFVTATRIQWLIENKKVVMTAQPPSSSYYEGTTIIADLALNFIFLKSSLKASDGQDLWALYYDVVNLYKPLNFTFLKAANEAEALLAIFKPDPQDKDYAYYIKGFKNYLTTLYAAKEASTLAKDVLALPKEVQARYATYYPALAMVNPNISYPAGDYRNAMTGDYDLFAIWTKTLNSDDLRVAGMTQTTTNKDIVNAENNSKVGAAVGNISNRIYEIGQNINSVIMAKTSCRSNRVFHSDEGGRPYVDDVDSAVVFDPDGNIWKINNAADLESCVHFYKEKGFFIVINNGWAKKKDGTPLLSDAALKKVTWLPGV